MDISQTHADAQEAHRKTCIQLTRDFGGVNLRYVARANGVADPVVIIIVAAINAVIIVVALRYGGRVGAITDCLVQIAHAHGRSDAGRHRRHVLRDRGNVLTLTNNSRPL